MNNERLRDLAVKLGVYMLESLNEWSLADIRKAIKRYSEGSNFEQGLAQFLRLYLAARTIGMVTKQ